MVSKEQNQRSILSKKIFEAVAEKHSATRSVLALASINGFEQNKNGDYAFIICSEQGMEEELLARKATGKNFKVFGLLRIKNRLSTTGIYMSLIYRDGILWGFQQDYSTDVDRAVRNIRQKSIVVWNGDFNDSHPDSNMGHSLSESRKAFLKDLAGRVKSTDKKLPLLTLAEFFDGNTEEDSIAPNQWGYGRPSLSEIWARMRGVEERADVAWVRVLLHPDTDIAEYEGGTTCIIAGNSIAICTTAGIEDIEKTVDPESICSDGIVTGQVSLLKDFTDVPIIPDGYSILLLVWD